METPLYRRSVSYQLIDEICHGLANRQSALIIAPNFGGKSFVADNVQVHLEDFGVKPIRLEFSRGSQLSDEEGLLDVLRATGVASPVARLNDFFAGLNSQFRSDSRPICLILSRLDRVGRNFAQQFLKEVRTATNSPSRWMSALITIESELLDMVLGEKSEFNCANRYLLQGCDLRVFSDSFDLYASALNLTFRDHRGACETLYELTGGNTYLARQALLTCVEGRLSLSTLSSGIIETVEIVKVADLMATPGSNESPMFRQTATITEALLEQVENLDALNQDQPVAAHPGAPNFLELSGAAKNQDGLLYFSSPLMKRFVQREFHARRVGDLHGLSANWGKAFKRYGSADSVKRGQHTLYERLVMRQIVRRLCDTIRQTSGDGLRSLVRDSLNLLFSVDPTSSFHECYKRESGWIAIPAGPEWLLKEVVGQQSHSTAYKDRKVSTFVISNQETIAVCLPTDFPVWLCEEVQVLIDGYGAAMISTRKVRIERSLDAVLQSVFSRLHSVPTGLRALPSTILDKMLSVLRKEGFRAWACLTTPDAWLGAAPHFSLEDIFTCCESLSDLGENRYLIRFVDGQSVLGATVIEVPLDCCLNGEHVMPLLLKFADQLSKSLAYCEETHRASEALDRLAETVLVVDRKWNVRFINSSGLDLWPDIQSSSSEQWDSELREGIVKVLQTRQRFANFPTRLAGSSYEGIVVFEPLLDNERVLGVMVHVQQKSYYSDLLNGFRVLVAAASERQALECLIELFRSIGINWVRVYKINVHQLLPDQCIDSGRPDVQAAFLRIKLPLRDESPTWYVIREKEPHVFSFQEELEDGKIFFTAEGLPVIAQNAPPASNELAKKPGDFWIDFPLMRGDDVIGKLTFPCPEKLTPERFQMFKILADLVSETLVRLDRNSNMSTPARIEVLKKDLRESIYPLEVLEALVEKAFATRSITDKSIDNLKTVVGKAVDSLHLCLQASGIDN